MEDDTREQQPDAAKMIDALLRGVRDSRPLVLGQWGVQFKSCYQDGKKFRRALEASALDVYGVVPISVAILIDTATRWETVCRICQRLVAGGGKSAVSQTLSIVKNYCYALGQRNAAIAKLGIDVRQVQKETTESLYQRPLATHSEPAADDGPQATEPGDRMARLQILYSRPVLSAGDDPPQQPASGPQASRGSRLAPGRPRTPPVPGNAAEGRTQDEVVQW